MHFSILMDIGNRGPGDADKSQDLLPCRQETASPMSAFSLAYTAIPHSCR